MYVLLHLYVFRLKWRAELLAKAPPYLLFMIAALYSAAALFWLLLAAIGLAPLCRQALCLNLVNKGGHSLAAQSDLYDK